MAGEPTNDNETLLKKLTSFLDDYESKKEEEKNLELIPVKTEPEQEPTKATVPEPEPVVKPDFMTWLFGGRK